MNLSPKVFSLSFIIFGLSSCAAVKNDMSVPALLLYSAAKIEVTSNLQTPIRRAHEYAAKYGAKKTLIIFDVDNTLLTATDDLGSDGWFKWQKGLLKSNPSSPDLVAKNFGNLLKIQYFLFNNANMRPTQDNLLSLIAQLSDKNIPTVALTARGSDIRNATENKLKEYQINFKITAECTAPLCLKRGDITGNELISASKNILSPADQIKFNFTKARPIGVSGGLMMVAGQDKGLMLRLLLKSIKNKKIQNVIFVDDTFKNIKNVQNAFADSPYRISIFHYEKFEHDVNDFQTNKKRQAETTRIWLEIRKPICQNLKPAWCE
jgi:hypothetical protein